MSDSKKSPRNFGEMLSLLSSSLREDADAIFSQSDAEIDRLLADEGIDSTWGLKKVQGILAAARLRLRKETDSLPSRRAFIGKNKHFWSNRSVVRLATKDPVDFIHRSASSIVLEAIQAGWEGPPFDPVWLAKFMNIAVVPRSDIADARIIPTTNRNLEIQFNPNKPKARIRFSIAHELAHAIFPDCREAIRNRLSKEAQQRDDWQLETLCNLAAAEFLMPTAHFPELKNADLSIHQILELRKTFEVSTEAVLLRLARLTETPCAIFAASRRKCDRFSVEYAVSSRAWPVSIPSGMLIPEETYLNECTVLGYTTVGDEQWLPELGLTEIQGVRISPFPGEDVPRVVGIIKPKSSAIIKSERITFITGDATETRGSGWRVIAHVVNDKTPNWGAGFARTIQRKWPEIQQAFKAWSAKNPRSLSLGNVFHSNVLDEEITVFQMICQHGYGPSPTPRLRYAHLKTCLEKLREFAFENNASVHMPRIGSGEAGGSWQLVQQMIDEILCAQGVKVTIYSLPNARSSVNRQPSLFS